MPPRRGTRAPSSSRLFDNSSEAGGPLDSVSVNRLNPTMSSTTTTGRGMSPGPAKYSSAYGSPPTILPARQNVARQRYNFSSALSHVVDAVEQDNENDARERAQQDAVEQNSNSRAQSLQPPPPMDSIRATRAPSKQPTPQPQLQPATTATAPPEETDQINASPDSAQLVREFNESRSRAPAPPESAPTQETPAPSIFTDADRIFAEAQISTPTVSRPSVVAKTSNILHSIFSSARRMTTTREDEEFENVRQAFPRLQFFRPRPDSGPAEVVEPFAETTAAAAAAEPAPATAAAAAAAAAEAEAPAAADTETATATTRAGNVAKSLKSRIITPGPSQRNRRSLFKPTSHDVSQDELAANDGTTGSAIMTARSLLGRRRPQAQVQVVSRPTDDARPDRRERERSERPDRHRGSQAPDVSSTVKNGRSRETSARPTKKHSSTASYATKPGPFSGVAELSKVFSLAVTLIVFGLIALRVFVVSTATPELYEGYRVDNRLHWYGDDWRSNLRQLVPSVLLHPLGAISDDEFAKMNGIIVSHANEVAQMKHASRLNSATLERINRILPAMVHMELDRNGRPVISQEFWHALKDNIQADRDIFTLIWDKDGGMGVSDLQWTALKRQLQASGFVPADPSSKALTVSDVEGIAAASLSKSWEAWLRTNERKVRDILHIQTQPQQPQQSPQQQAPDYDQLAGHVVERLSASQLAKLARQMANSREAKEMLVPRQDFLQILQSSFVEHRSAIKGEMAELEERVLEVARAAAQAVKDSLASSPVEHGGAVPTGVDPRNGGAVPGHMSKNEIMTLVDQLVRKSVSDAQLEAMSRGKIKANWQTNLINQVNFFSRSSGAVIDHEFSSPNFEPAVPPTWTLWNYLPGWAGGSASGASSHRAGRGSSRNAKSGADVDDNRPRPGMPHNSVVFERWEEDGDCWCGAIAANSPVSVGVKLGLRILPQYLVVEHISQTATLDPGAMPKGLELWVQITDYEQQRPLQDWSSLQFGDGPYGLAAYNDGDMELLDAGFVKVGEYTFDGAGSGSASGSGSIGISGLSGAGAAQVFRVSPELEALEAATDHVVVRAMTNHGNKDHTCFYRVRMYGQRRD